MCVFRRRGIDYCKYFTNLSSSEPPISTYNIVPATLHYYLCRHLKWFNDFCQLPHSTGRFTSISSVCQMEVVGIYKLNHDDIFLLHYMIISDAILRWRIFRYKHYKLYNFNFYLIKYTVRLTAKNNLAIDWCKLGNSTFLPRILEFRGVVAQRNTTYRKRLQNHWAIFNQTWHFG